MKSTRANDEEMEISILDLLKHILYKWRVILVWMLILAVLAGLFCVYKNTQTNKDIDAQNASIPVDTEADADALATGVTLDNLSTYGEGFGLNDNQISNIQMALNMYDQLQQYYTYADQYNQQVDILDVSDQQVLEYNLSVTATQGSSVEAANSLAYNLYNYATNGGMTTAILEAGYDGADQDNLGEDIAVSYEELTTRDNNLAILAQLPFTITCKGEDAEDLAAYVDQTLQAQLTQYASLGTVSLDLMSQYTITVRDTSLADKQDSIRVDITDQINELKDYTASFNKAQILLFNAVAGQDYLTVPTEETTDESGEVTVLETQNHISLTTGLVKYLIIGLLLGIFLPCCWYGLFYLLDGTVKTKEDFEDVFGLYCLGDLSSPKQHKGLDKLLDKLFRIQQEPIEDRQQMLLANIKAICKKQDRKEICLTTTIVLSEDLKAQIKEICDQLQKEGITATYQGNVMSNVAGFETMVACGNTALIEQTTASKITSLDKMAAICNEHHVDVLGVINC